MPHSLRTSPTGASPTTGNAPDIDGGGVGTEPEAANSDRHEAPASVLDVIAQPDAQGLKLLRDAAETMRLSARGYHRVLRVARTLADLDGVAQIGRLHLAEALSYRALAEDLRRAA